MQPPRGAPPTVVPGRRPVAECLRAGRPLREVVVAAGADLGALTDDARAAGVRVRTAPRSELDDLAGGVVHQGVVGTGPAWPPVPLADVASGDLVVVLDGITDPHNLGAIARTAEAVGAAGLVVPRRRTAGASPAAHKAAAGALAWLPLVVVPNVTRGLADLAAAGFWSVGLDGGAADDLWGSPLLEGKVAVVVGAEGTGLSRLVRERCDGLVAVPQRGRVASLNASAAAAVVLYEVARRRVGVR